VAKSGHDQSSRSIFWCCIALLVAAVLGGGGQGGLGDVGAQLLAVVLLAQLGWLAFYHRLTWRSNGWVRWLPVLALALPVLQLLPIPSAWWSIGPARAELAAQLAAAGVIPTGVISLNPGATERSLWWLLPPVALFLGTLCLPRADHRRLLAAVLALAALSVLLGMAQIAEGPESALRFYSNTNRTEAVGFFANRNHLATLLVMALPLALAATGWGLTERLDGRHVSPLWLVCGSGLVIFLILGIAIASSRAGLLLGMLAVFGSLPIVLSFRKRRGARRVLALAVGIAVLLSVQFALLGILQRLERDPLDDARWEYARTTREAAAAYAPLGSGLGTFRQAFQPFEAKYRPGPVIVNHAHNDYLELWLEGGMPAVILMGLGGLAWAWRGVQLWWLRSPEPADAADTSRWLARVAWLSASLSLIHSTLDYPLRTTANLSVFAVLTAIAYYEPRAHLANREGKVGN
jgi:O-antigen ligase